MRAEIVFVAGFGALLTLNSIIRDPRSFTVSSVALSILTVAAATKDAECRTAKMVLLSGALATSVCIFIYKKIFNNSTVAKPAIEQINYTALRSAGITLQLVQTWQNQAESQSFEGLARVLNVMGSHQLSQCKDARFFEWAFPHIEAMAMTGYLDGDECSSLHKKFAEATVFDIGCRQHVDSKGSVSYLALLLASPTFRASVRQSSKMGKSKPTDIPSPSLIRSLLHRGHMTVNTLEAAAEALACSRFWQCRDLSDVFFGSKKNIELLAYGTVNRLIGRKIPGAEVWAAEYPQREGHFSRAMASVQPLVSGLLNKVIVRTVSEADELEALYKLYLEISHLIVDETLCRSIEEALFGSYFRARGAGTNFAIAEGCYTIPSTCLLVLTEESEACVALKEKVNAVTFGFYPGGLNLNAELDRLNLLRQLHPEIFDEIQSIVLESTYFIGSNDAENLRRMRELFPEVKNIFLEVSKELKLFVFGSAVGLAEANQNLNIRVLSCASGRVQDLWVDDDRYLDRTDGCNQVSRLVIPDKFRLLTDHRNAHTVFREMYPDYEVALNEFGPREQRWDSRTNAWSPRNGYTFKKRAV